jgi:hypothetical protein
MELFQGGSGCMRRGLRAGYAVLPVFALGCRCGSNNVDAKAAPCGRDFDNEMTKLGAPIGSVFAARVQAGYRLLNIFANALEKSSKPAVGSNTHFTVGAFGRIRTGIKSLLASRFQKKKN